jgi:hypothetical protein
MATREQNGSASAQRDGSKWPRASKMGVPALSAMAANGHAQAKWECPRAQRNSSKWPRASKIGIPQPSAQWQQMASREQNGACLGAMAANGLSGISNNQKGK